MGMYDEQRQGILVSVIILALVLGFIIGGFTTSGAFYRRGQLDAISGDIKYEIREGGEVWKKSIFLTEEVKDE